MLTRGPLVEGQDPVSNMLSSLLVQTWEEDAQECAEFVKGAEEMDDMMMDVRRELPGVC